MKKSRQKILVILGPTATGKSDLAVTLARKFDGEVISADSRQVYRGLDIGSGKITRVEMRGVPHHLLDVADPAARKRYTVEDFRRDGERAIADIAARGKLPIIVGGTGFYIDALVNGTEFPAVSPDKKLRAELAKKTPAALMKMLAKLDPRRARDMDPHNKVRIIRAIEIARALGKVPKLTTAKNGRRPDAKYDPLYIGLTLPPDELRARIRDRLEKRMRAGMDREVARLRKGRAGKNGAKKSVSWKRLHEFGLEYRALALFAQKKIARDEMLRQLEQDIAAFAKRQMTWFKKNPSIKWFRPDQKPQVEREVRRFAP